MLLKAMAFPDDKVVGEPVNPDAVPLGSVFEALTLSPTFPRSVLRFH